MGMWKVVCVTDASAYIASWIVRLLLDRGYTVRATVRDTDMCGFSQFIWLHFYLPLNLIPDAGRQILSLLAAICVYLGISLKVDSTEPKHIKAYCYYLSFMFQTHLILHISTVCLHAQMLNSIYSLPYLFMIDEPISIDHDINVP
ncbi:hypothetical protein Zm00014a_026103 [Zea mays]|uniref:NmrA-like domain-containing protein n=1 Tax=Zea mays TaxID=4577 RepID=A0A3L6FHW0_MAIZE|nr:hypothetical protein Zm00014a_026103 [Zea mays]